MGKLLKSIKDWYQKNQERIIQVILLLLVAAASFGLGYLVRGESDRAPIIIEKNS